MTNKIINTIEIVSLNIINGSVIVWLNTVVTTIPVIVSVLVGVSILTLNGIKIYKELKK